MSSNKGLAILAVIAMAAAPAFGAIHLRVLVNRSSSVDLDISAGPVTAIVGIEAMCDANAGVVGGGGSVVADTPGVLSTVPDSIERTGRFVGPFVGMLCWEWGAEGPDGGWLGVGVAQNLLAIDPSIGNGWWVELVHYSVETVGNPGDSVTLNIIANDNGCGGTISNVCIDTNICTDVGAEIGAQIHIVPEPATLALLALGSVAALRRRN